MDKGSRVAGLPVQRAPVPRCACDCLPVAAWSRSTALAGAASSHTVNANDNESG